MASPNGILRAYKAMPGAASLTVAPQGANAPYFGAISPLQQQLADPMQGYTRAYGPGFLPRQPSTFTQGAFGPFSPILPVPVDQPAPGADMPDARREQFQVGWNLPVGQPGTEGIKLADFGTLKTLADLYSVARACIELRKNELAGLEWDIVPTKDAAKAYNGSNRAMKDFGDRRGQVVKFFARPDPDYFSFQTFMTALLEEIFVFDALSLLIRPKRGKGLHRGVLGSDLDCLELISGPTMRPLYGMHGETPRPPNPAYQQYLYGVPRSDYMTMITERDILEAGLTDAEVNSWTTDQFLYLPMVPRRWTPYGYPPVERALIPIMSGLQKQAFQLDYFKEGTIPAVYISPGDVNMTPNQIRELQDALNAFAGDPAWHHKVIVLPPGSRVDPQKAVDVADQFDDVVMTQVCMAFDVNPMELGILPKVTATASPGMIKQMAQGQASVHERLSTKPTLKFLAGIFDGILHSVLGQDDMKFTFEGLTEDAEQGMLTGLLIQQVQSGLRSVDEARDALELQPWGLDMTSGPVVFTAAGPIPFSMPPMLPATQGQAQGGAQDATKKPPTAGPAPLQQAGRQGGVAAATPGHAAATAANSSVRSGRAPSVSAPASGSVSAAKAVTSELEALARHLNKGRQISTWEAKYIPGSVVAMISEDLAKGLSPVQCTDIARTILLGDSEYEWLPKEEARRDAPWSRLWESYSPQIDAAFGRAVALSSRLIRDWWSGTLVLTRNGLVDAIRAVIQDELEPVLKNLWADSWRQNDETAGGYYEAWEASHGRDAVEQIAGSRLRKVNTAISAAVQSGRGPDQVIAQLAALLDVSNRARMIAVTEMGRAGTAAAITRFRSQNVSHKEWLTAGDARVCAACRSCQDEGPLPLDSLFKNGLLGPPGHPNCRCDLMPAISQGVTLKLDGRKVAEESRAASLTCNRRNPGNRLHLKVGPKPEQDLHPGEHDIECGRGHTHHGEHGAAGLLIRHKGDDGKLRYLLQKRSPDEDDPGTWSLPGGALLAGETVEQGAYREAQEEFGPLPQGVTTSHHVTDDHDGWQWTTVVCDTPESFAPAMHEADTAFETDGWGWFTKDEIGQLPLHPGFRDSWEATLRARKSTTLSKCAVRRVNLDGQVTWEHPDPCPCGGPRQARSGDQAAGGGGPEFMPHDAEGIQDGRASGSRGGGTAGHNDDAGLVRPHGLTQPAGDDGQMAGGPMGTGSPQTGLPQGYAGGYWPEPVPGLQPPATPGPDGPRSTGTGYKCLTCGCHRPDDDHGDHRHITQDDLEDAAEAADLPPGQAAENILDEERALTLGKGENKASEVYAQLEGNFPDDAIQWVKECHWEGPQDIPLDDIDWRDHKEWAAWHEQDHVEDFKRKLQAGESIHPPVLVHHPGKKAAIIIDGHHRSMAFEQLGMPVHGWLGEIPEHFIQAALETHSSQHNQGDAKGNQ